MVELFAESLMPKIDKLGSTELLVLYILATHKGWTLTKSLIGMLGMTGVSEPAARATIFRLKRKDIIRLRRSGRNTSVALGSAGRSFLETYMNMLSRSERKWDGKWLLVSFNIPESRRPARNAFRDRLVSMGFGRLHANLWISPYDVRAELGAVARKLRIEANIAMFITEYVSDDPRAFAFRVWDLGNLTRKWEGLRMVCRAQCASYRRMRFADPGKAAAEALSRLIRLKRTMVGFVEHPSPPRELLPNPPAYYKAMGNEIFRCVDFLRNKASSIIRFTPIPHEKYHGVGKQGCCQ